MFNGSFIGVNKLFYGCSYGCVPTFLPHALHMDKRQCGHSNAPVKWTTLLLEAPISITSGEPSSKVHWINRLFRGVNGLFRGVSRHRKLCRGVHGLFRGVNILFREVLEGCNGLF